MMAFNRLAISAAALVLIAAISIKARSTDAEWTTAEIEDLQTLSLSALEPLPADPTNRVADDPAAAELGRRLFFDTRFSSNGQVACATCHKPELDFQDGTPLANGVGTTNRRTMPIAGMAYAPFLFWDGRKDSLWAQALGPLESAVEHGGNRAQYALVMSTHYRTEYEQVFGAMPGLSAPDAVTAIFVNMGKAIAAYERRIEFTPARFDRYVDAIGRGDRTAARLLTQDEIKGLKLFMGKANCTQCHNGPLFTNNEFHNTGVPPVAALPTDRGRFEGMASVLKDEFNCRSKWSDASPAACSELEFMPLPSHEQERAFKVPTLRNVAERAPYMHAGQLVTLRDTLEHYNTAPAAPAGHTELKPLNLNERELAQLEAFLRTLSGGTVERVRPAAKESRRD